MVVLHGLGTVFREISFPHRREAVRSAPVVRHDSFMGVAFLNPRSLAVKGSGPITCERKAVLLNEWAIDPALFCCPLFFPFLLWVSFGVFLGVGSLHTILLESSLRAVNEKN